MDDAPVISQHHWFQSGWFALGLVVVGILGAIFFIRLHPVDRSANITLNPLALKNIPTTDVEVRSYDDPYLGNENAKVVVVEFGDFQCPFCKQAFPIVRGLMNAFSDRVLFIYRDYPISDAHPDAQKAAEAGQCAWDQGANQFWALHDRLFLNQNDLTVPFLKEHASAAGLERTLFDQCLDSGANASEVATDYADGLRAGVRGTPTFFINGRRYEGPLSKSVFEQILQTELNAAK